MPARSLVRVWDDLLWQCDSQSIFFTSHYLLIYNVCSFISETFSALLQPKRRDGSGGIVMATMDLMTKSLSFVVKMAGLVGPTGMI